MPIARVPGRAGASGWTPRVLGLAMSLFFLVSAAFAAWMALELPGLPVGSSDFFGTGYVITPAGYGLLGGWNACAGTAGVARYFAEGRRRGPARDDASSPGGDAP